MNDELKQFYRQNTPQVSLSDERSARVKGKIFAQLGTRQVEEPAQSAWAKVFGSLSRAYIIAPLCLVLFLGVTTYASADSLPGDPMYGVKLKIEAAQVMLSPTAEAKLKLRMKFAEKRLAELQALRAAHIPQQAIDNHQSDKIEVEIKADSENHGSTKVEVKLDGKLEQRQEKAEQEALKAIEKLDNAKNKFEAKIEHHRSEEIKNRVEELKNELKDDNEEADLKGEQYLKVKF
jgi:hypothetical protein